MQQEPHTFRQPAKPLEPPTPRPSTLGLDRLASEKRAAAAQNGGDAKRPRLDSGGAQFKGELCLFSSYPLSRHIHPVPSLPASRISNARQRGEETPSHPGGLSKEGRNRLEEYRRKRDHQRGVFTPVSCFHFPSYSFQRVSLHTKKRRTTARVAWTTSSAV